MSGRGNLITASEIAEPVPKRKQGISLLATTEGEKITSALLCLVMTSVVEKNRVDPFLNEKTFDSARGAIIRTNILENLDYYLGGIKDVKHPCN